MGFFARRKQEAERRLAVVFLEPGRHFGYESSRAAHVRVRMYPILTEWYERGWLNDGWEDPADIDEDRPPRRYYWVTPLGRVELTKIVGRVT